MPYYDPVYPQTGPVALEAQSHPYHQTQVYQDNYQAAHYDPQSIQPFHQQQPGFYVSPED